MSNPKRQHFIPRSYLNNFAIEEQTDTFFVFAKRRNEDKGKKISTKDLCVNKNLYTLPSDDKIKKFAIENFYGDNVDSIFPEVYRILTNENTIHIDFDTRLKIINTALSLYFRTPKFLNKQNKMVEDVIKHVRDNTNFDTVKINFLGEELVFNRETAEKIIKEKKENNRISFLVEHLQAYEKFVSCKLLDQINVYKIVDESELITCDNPVIISPFSDPTAKNYSYEDNLLKNPFDSNNYVHLPLDSKHMLSIMPKLAGSSVGEIRRQKIETINTIMYNSDIEKNCEDWIIGSETGLCSHISDQVKYNEETPENIKMFDDFKEKVIGLREFTDLLEMHGIHNELVKNKIKQMESNPIYKDDHAFKYILKNIHII